MKKHDGYYQNEILVCAEKIFDYAKAIGVTPDSVRVTAYPDWTSSINIVIVDDYGMMTAWTSIVPKKDIASILSTGFMRCDMLLAQISTKH